MASTHVCSADFTAGAQAALLFPFLGFLRTFCLRARAWKMGSSGLSSKRSAPELSPLDSLALLLVDVSHSVPLLIPALW